MDTTPNPNTNDSENIQKTLYPYLNTGDYETARKLVYAKLDNIDTEDEITFATLELYGFLIDLGHESHNIDDLERAILFWETNESIAKTHMGKTQYHYNLANAKHALDYIFWINNPGVQNLSVIKNRFQEAINLYWIALKSISSEDKSLEIQIKINLSISLSYVSRIVEAIQFVDTVLLDYPYHRKALSNKAEHLKFLSELTNGSVSIALYTEIFFCFFNAMDKNKMPPTIYHHCKHNAAIALNTIRSKGFDITNRSEDLTTTQKEYENLPAFRRFCIDHYLTLNEHGLYCQCNQNAKDDLQIGVRFGKFSGNLVPKLELLLNRVKSEFAFARWNFYKSHIDEPFDYDVLLSDLGDNEIINSNAEMLRASYRICYGILDKIALGICKLYQLDATRIFFESFWIDEKRWEVLNQQKNIHLNALYSIACDLNTRVGELRHFKEWRNKLEHNLLILKKSESIVDDSSEIFDDKDFAIIVKLEEFKEKTLHLLRVTRSAIFSFAYCVRLQTIDHPDEGDNYPYYDTPFKKN